MSRVIKFRAWDGNRMIMPEDKAYYQHYISFCGNIIQRSSEGMSCFGGQDKWRVERDLQLMQFAGLTDKNGAEIYENSEIDNEFIVSVKGCDYVLISISCGDIVRLQDYYSGANGNVEITREYARIQKNA
jgi:hypothetical protein